MDLLGLVKEQLTTSVIEKISGLLGESQSTTSSALGSAMPALLGGLMQKASTTQGATGILDLIKTGGNEGNILENIFGDKVGAVANVVSKASGMKQESSSSLLSMAAPILMGVIGKQVGTSGMGLSGLTSLLMGQKDAVKAALPAGMGSILDINSLGDFLGNAKGGAAKIEDAVEKSTSGIGKWLPWAILAALVLGAFFYLKGCQNTTQKVIGGVENVVDSTAKVAVSVADSASNTVATGIDALGSFFKRKLPNGVELNIPEMGIENKLVTFVEDKNQAVDKTTWFNFDRINFETGKSTLDSASKEQVKNIAEILNAFPNVNIKVGGYTDNTGNAKANVRLSQDRAATVMNAILAAGKLKADRIEAEGYGDQHPVASNDTEEGRAQNRRIAVRVTKK